MKNLICLICVGWLLTCPAWADSPPKPSRYRFDLGALHQAASNAPSLLLNDNDKRGVVDSFLLLVGIKGSSGQEKDIREFVSAILTSRKAKELPIAARGSNPPLNLMMEFPATGAFKNQPGILLNAHLDTILESTPELMRYDATNGDFYHQYDAEPGKISSFGGDDRSGVAVILEAIRKLKSDYWDKGVPHRRIVLFFTADEERGCVGAKYLTRSAPELFTNLAFSLSIDGPLDYQTAKESIVTVVAKEDADKLPYKHVLGLTRDYCARTKLRTLQTEVGLGFGDFAFFPPAAKSGLHLRSPVRGWHNHERVNIRDLINHVDLLCFLLLGWDKPLPAKISPEVIVPPK